MDLPFFPFYSEVYDYDDEEIVEIFGSFSISARRTG